MNRYPIATSVAVALLFLVGAYHLTVGAVHAVTGIPGSDLLYRVAAVEWLATGPLMLAAYRREIAAYLGRYLTRGRRRHGAPRHRAQARRMTTPRLFAGVVLDRGLTGGGVHW